MPTERSAALTGESNQLTAFAYKQDNTRDDGLQTATLQVISVQVFGNYLVGPATSCGKFIGHGSSQRTAEAR